MGDPEDRAYLTVFGAPPSPVAVRVRALGPGRRAARALGVLAATWGLAALSVLIPVAHLILVPGLLLAGPLLAYLRFRASRVVTAVHGACPRCGVEQDFRPPKPWGSSMTTECPRCLNRLVLAGLGGATNSRHPGLG